MEIPCRQKAPRGTGRLAAVAAAMILAMLPCGPASAQRNGDVSGGKDHQPTQGEVQSREQAGGVAPAPARREQQDGTVDNLYRDLMTKERSDGMTSAPAEPNATAPHPPAPASAPGAAPTGTRP